MFQSLTKRVKESLDDASTKADSLIAQARTQINNRQQSTTTNPTTQSPADPPTTAAVVKASNAVVCTKCARSLTVYETMWMKTNHKCRVCAKIFCTKCVGKSPIPVPTELLHSEYQQSKEGESKLDEKQIICLHGCLPHVTSYAFDKFCKDMNEKTFPNLLAYLRNDSMHHEFFPMPSAAAEDTNARRAFRAAQVVDKIADFTSFSMILKVAKYVYYGSEILNIVLDGDMYSVLSPLLGSLKAYGIDGPTALLRLYYLGCKHTLEYKQHIAPMSLLYDDSAHGVLAQQCPKEILDYVNRYLSGAEWLYTSQLPPPHNSNHDWSSWYLSRMIARQQWTVIMCINDSTKLPNGMKCPAFALLARKRQLKSTSSHGDTAPKYHKEVMLIIRGSQSSVDWSINFDEGMLAFDYNYYPADSDMMHTATGYVHKGIQVGAKGILDGYNVRQYLMKFLQQQYSIKIVGHSLGAGVAALVAAEMRNTAILHHLQILSNPSLSNKHPSEETNIESIYHQVHRISAIVFSAPAIVNDTLANVFLLDRLLINIVNGHDTIPRLNRLTFQRLAMEMQEFVPQANEWTEQDKLDLTDYVTSLGKASDIFLSTKEMRKQRTQRLKKGSSSNSLTITNENTAAQGDNESNDFMKTAQRNVTTASKNIGSLVSYFNSTVTTTVSNLTTTNANGESVQVSESTEKVAQEVHSADTMEEVSSSDPNLLEPQEIQEASAPSLEEHQLIRNDLVSVTPGPIVHLYKDNDGYVRASVVTHQHEAFQKITLLPNYLLSEHKISSYRKMLQSSIFSAKQRPSQHRNNFLNQEQQDYYSRYFPKCIMDEALYDEYETKLASAIPDGEEKLIENTATANAMPVKCDGKGPSEESFSFSGYFKPIFSKKNNKDVSKDITVDEMLRKDNYVSASPEENNSSSGSVASADDEEDEWVPCGICGLEVTWPYRMHSDAARALVTHHCCNCGIVICTLCGPAGEKLPGDGVNTSYSLPDFRITLPHRGLFGLQRVCVHCYFDSSHPGI